MNKKDCNVIILAGGKGTRLWPISNENTPKQLLKINGKDEMINVTCKRALKVAFKENIHIVTNRKSEKEIKRVTHNINDKYNKYGNEYNIIVEDISVGTLYSIKYALEDIIKKSKVNNNSMVLIMPSDQFVFNENEFAEVVKKTFNVAHKTKDIVLIATKTKRIESRFGYILTKKDKSKNVRKALRKKDKVINNYKQENNEIINVNKFSEKPSKEKIKNMKQYYYFYKNTGMIVCNAKVLLYKINNVLNIKSGETKSEIIKKCDNISIDVGLLEKSKNMKAIISNFRWIDIGTFESLENIVKKDCNNNLIITSSDFLEISDSKNLIVYDDREDIDSKIVIKNLEDAVIAISKNDILIRKKIMS